MKGDREWIYVYIRDGCDLFEILRKEGRKAKKKFTGKVIVSFTNPFTFPLQYTLYFDHVIGEGAGEADILYLLKIRNISSQRVEEE